MLHARCPGWRELTEYRTAELFIAVVVGSVFLKDRFSSAPAEPDAVKAGDNLPNLDGWSWGAHDQTLVLVLRKGCHFCEDSAPFYQGLLSAQEQRGSNTTILAVFPDNAETVKEVVQSEALRVDTLAGVPMEQLKVTGTPTLMLVDKTGTVLNAWSGMLSPREELEVIRATTASNADALKSPG